MVIVDSFSEWTQYINSYSLSVICLSNIFHTKNYCKITFIYINNFYFSFFPGIVICN